MDMSKLDERFSQIYAQIFQLSEDTGERNFNSNGLTDQNISLLLTWPGVMACKFGATVNENKMVDDLLKLEPLKPNVNVDNDDPALKDLTLHKDSERAQEEQNQEISIMLCNIASKMNFLQMISNAHFDDVAQFEELIRLFCDYTIVCFAIIRHLRTKETKIELPHDNTIIGNEFASYLQHNLIYFHLTCLSMQWLSMVDDPFQHFSDDDFNFEIFFERNDIDDYFDELFGTQKGQSTVKSQSTVRDHQISSYLCAFLFEIGNEIIDVYEKLSGNFQHIEKEVRSSASNDIEKLNYVIKNIGDDTTFLDIFLQYKKYFEAVKNLKNKALNGVIEKKVKNFFKEELTDEMLLSLIKATREYLNLVTALKYKIKLLERVERDDHKKFTLYGMDNCKGLDDTFLEAFFEDQKKKNKYKYLKYLTFQELFYIDVNPGEDGEDKEEEGNVLFLVEGDRKNWRRDIVQRILPKIKLCLEKERNPSEIKMAGSKIVREKIGESKIMDGVVDVVKYVENNKDVDDPSIGPKDFQYLLNTSNDYVGQEIVKKGQKG